MTDRQTGSSTRETTIGNQSALLTQVFRFDVRGRIEHLLHTGATFRPFVSDYHHVTRNDFSTQNAGTSSVLRSKHFGRTGEFPDAFVHTGGLDNATVQRDIAFQNSQTPIFGVGMSSADIRKELFRVAVETNTPLLTLKREEHSMEDVFKKLTNN